MSAKSICVEVDREAVALIRAWHDELWAGPAHDQDCGCERCEMAHAARAWLEQNDRESERSNDEQR